MGTKNWLQDGKWQLEHSLSTGAGVVRGQEASLLGSTREGSSGGRPRMKRSQKSGLLYFLTLGQYKSKTFHRPLKRYRQAKSG